MAMAPRAAVRRILRRVLRCIRIRLRAVLLSPIRTWRRLLQRLSIVLAAALLDRRDLLGPRLDKGAPDQDQRGWIGISTWALF